MFNRNRNLSPRFNNRKIEEQIHYENLISFLKTCIGIGAFIIGVIASVAIYFSYSSLKDMRSDYASTIQDLNNQLARVQENTYKTVSDIKQDSKDAVTATKDYSEKELSRIEQSTNQIALDETKKQLSDIFQTDRIKDLVQNQAVKEIKNQVDNIIYSQTKNLGKISDAAAKMRTGIISAERELKSFFTNPESITDSTTAKNLYDEIYNDYLTQVDTAEAIKDISSEARLTPFNANAKLSPENASAISRIIELMNYKYAVLWQIAEYITYINIYSSRKFAIFDREGVEKWFNSKK